jgi:hypothetical protein
MGGSDGGVGKAMATRPLTIALATAALTWLSAAPAWATITIQLGNADANGGALTTVATGATSASFSGTYGDYDILDITGADIFPIAFGTNTFDVTSAATTNTLTVIATETGLTTVPSGFLSTLTENHLTNGWTVQETTWLNSTQLFSGTFSAVGSSQQFNLAAVSLPFSLSEKFVFTPNGGAGQDQSTISIMDIPEAPTWAMLGLGFAGLGIFRLATLQRKASRYIIRAPPKIN